MPEATTTETPRDALEEAERVDEPTQAELGHALGRILAWLLEGGNPVKIGVRVLVLAYKIRPDLIRGATLEDIAKTQGQGRSAVAKLGRSFSRTFGIRGINDKSGGEKSARYRAAWAAAEPGRVPRRVGPWHLSLVNRFCEMREAAEVSGELPRDDEGRLQMRRELDPIARFIAELETFQ